MKGEKFEIVLKDGTKKEAEFLTRIKAEEKNTEYVYYSIDDDTDEGGNVSIYASRIANEDGKEVIRDLVDEEERQFAYKLFAETYKKLREQKTEQ